jgi:[protein-PII] uridylyltransferase
VQYARGGPLPEGFVTSRIEAQINSVLLGKMGAEEAFPVRLGPPAGTPEQRNLAPTQVEFDNEVSNEFTVLDVRTADRTGLLHAITTHLSHARLMIYLALITTEAYRAVDVFYVTDLDHLKIDDPKRLARLRDELLALLGESI